MILACPGCDSRYDVTGHAPGQRFRCRCGTILTLTAPSSQAGLLACPHCGAGVSPTAHACEFCASELLLKACPRCLSRVFHGHKHCPECGAELDRAADASITELSCPRCTHTLRGRLIGDLLIDECPQCLGVFLDQVAIKRVITDRQQARAESLLGALPRAEVTMRPPPGGKMYLKCPSCKTIMNRRQFAAGSGVIVDVCKHHGTFFDFGELPAIIDFVMQGGLEKAERAEIERLRDQARREIKAAHASHLSVVEIHTDRSTALVDLLFTLWR